MADSRSARMSRRQAISLLGAGAGIGLFSTVRPGAMLQYVSPSAVAAAAHDFSLVYLGVHLIDNADLEALAEACAARNRWEFLLTMAPIPYPGGTGSPINPIAIF